ncbi:MAG: sigma-70 family RNA polymerase sigma factor, partial [Bacteroidota bacterium]
IADDKTDLKKRIVSKVRSLGYSREEAVDFYQQGFVQLNTIFQKGKYKGGNIKGYFYNVCVNLKLNDRRKRKEVLPGDSMAFHQEDHSTERQIVSNEQKELLNKWLAQLTEKCRDTLRLWDQGYSRQEIANQMGYNSPEQAGLARFRCMEKLQSLIDFKEWQKMEQS